MILQALHGYYQRMAEDGSIAQEGFKKVELPFLIVLGRDGEFKNLQDTRDRIGKKLVARSFLVPEEQGRSGKNSWQTANLLWDHYGYVLAWPKSESDEHREMARKQHSTFVANIRWLHECFPDDDEIDLVYRFLATGDFSAVFAHESWAECSKVPGCNLSFMIEGKTQLVCQNENVTAHVQASSTSVSDDNEDGESLPDIEGVCLITGEKSQIARLHPRTPIPGAKSNAKIVSFQKGMGFDSYGKKQSFNAQTSKSAAFAYTTALNQMLAKDSRQKMFVCDATTVFWAEKKSRLENVFADFFGEPSKENPDQLNAAVRELFKAPESGVLSIAEDLTRFYVLGLAPNSARIAVRFWYPGTVGEVARHIKQHFEDCDIIHGPKQPERLSLFRLLVSTALLEDSKNIPPNLAGDFMKSILTGRYYPKTLLTSAIRRCRAEQEVTYPRAALIKACLVREARLNNLINHEEVGMSLDTTNTNPGYVLGRLFATLERTQECASPGLNATIRDRFYGSASSTPVAVFPHLMKLKVHHIAKLNNRGQAVNLERLIGEIMDKVLASQAFPAHLSLHDQGAFAVGYYHQRQDFFTKKDQ